MATKPAAGTVSLLFVLFFSSVNLLNAAKITVKNSCPFTIWPGYTGSAGGGGWEAVTGNSKTVDVGTSWSAGRVWARTGCDFGGGKKCGSGDCDSGQLVCSGGGASGVSLAEFTILAAEDDWDVSLVDGFNLPLTITSTSCSDLKASCPNDIMTICPSNLAFPSGGPTAYCASPCTAEPTNAEYCCLAPDHGTAATCPASGIPTYSSWKGLCPDAYIFAYNDASSLRKCATGGDYTVEFCPGGVGTNAGGTASGSADTTAATAATEGTSSVATAVGVLAASTASDGAAAPAATSASETPPAEAATTAAAPKAHGGGSRGGRSKRLCKDSI